MRNDKSIGLGDRRSWRRYPVTLAIRWRLLLGKNVVESGTGLTVNLSSHGMLFETDRKLHPGVGIEVSIAWPVLLGNVARLQLMIAGEVVRTSGGRAAVRIRHHEFRTAALRRGAGTSAAYAGPSSHIVPARAPAESAAVR